MSIAELCMIMQDKYVNKIDSLTGESLIDVCCSILSLSFHQWPAFSNPFKRSVVYQSHILNLFRLGYPEKWLKRDTNQFFSLLLLPLLKCFSILFELELYWICCMYNNKKKRREGKKNSIRKWSRKQDGVIIDIQPNFKVFFE